MDVLRSSHASCAWEEDDHVSANPHDQRVELRTRNTAKTYVDELVDRKEMGSHTMHMTVE